MERSAIRDHPSRSRAPDYASLHPGYGLNLFSTPAEQRISPRCELQRQVIVLRGVRDHETERHEIEKRRRDGACGCEILADMKDHLVGSRRHALAAHDRMIE